tara:strand:- start:265 stop:651 length:387 start_codon:yes stop_codon:yes gene_type:complete
MMTAETESTKTPIKSWSTVEIILLSFLYLGSSYYLEVEILNGRYLDYHFSGWWIAYLIAWSCILFILDKLRFKLTGFPPVYDFLGSGSYFMAAGMIQGLSLVLGAIISISLGLCMGWGFYPFATCESL